MNNPSQSGVAALNVEELIGLAVGILAGLWRYRVAMVLSMWVTAPALWFFVFQMPDRYEASTRVFMDTESVLRPLLAGLSVDSNVDNELKMVSSVLTSKPNLESVARQTDMDSKTRNPLEYEYMLASLGERIQIANDRQGVFLIQFEDEERTVALAVVTALLNGLMEKTIGGRTDDTQEAADVLQAEIQNYENRLIEAENRLKEFKRKNIGVMPDDGTDYYQRLQTARQQAASTEQQLRISRTQKRTILGQLAGEQPVFGVYSADQPGSGGDTQIAALESQLANLLIEYTDKHPEVQKVQSQIERMRAQRAESQSGQPSSLNPLDLNPVYQNLKIQLSVAEVEQARLEEEYRHQQAAVTKLENLVNVIPEVESQLNQLNRDYEVVRDRYEEMLRRWEQLATSKRVSSRTEAVKFQVIEPPFSPLAPSGPPRVLYSIIAFFVSASIGVGIALVAHLFNPVVNNLRELRSFSVNVIGAVTMYRTPVRVMALRRNYALLAVGAVALVVALGGVSWLAGTGFKI